MTPPSPARSTDETRTAPADTAYRVRTARPEDWAAILRTGARAFGFPMSAPMDEARALAEYDRTLLAEDGRDVVGVAGAYSLQMSVPGGVRPVAGVTWVSVSPTHRRRGILSSLMRRQLEDLHAGQRESVAALWASEAGIYGRYGYGQASSRLELRVPREAAATHAATDDDDLAVWFAEPAEAREEMAVVHDAQVPVRPGQFRLDHRWWDRLLSDPESRRDGATELRCLLAHDGRRTRGYALFATVERWRDGLPAGELRVKALTALDPGAYAALWRTLLGMDLVSTVVAWNRPVDDPLLHLLVDPRRAVPRLQDNLWVRLVDVDRALTARCYAAALDVVVEVADEPCPWNAGRWRLSADESGATCARTRDQADLSVSARELGAAYLGGTSLATLACAGRVRELRPGALRAASRAFAGDIAPWCPMVF